MQNREEESAGTSGERVTKTRRKEKTRKLTQIRNRRKRFEIDKTNRSTITLSTSLQLLRFRSQVCSLHLSHHAFFCFVFALFKWILIHLNSNVVSLHAFYFVHWEDCAPIGVQPSHLLGQVTRPDLLIPTFFSKKNNKRKKRRFMIFFGIFILRFEFFFL